MAAPKPDLNDPEYAKFAWARYRRLMKWMVLVAVLAVIASLGALWIYNGPIPIHMMIATIAGVGASVLLAAALMGLVFLSSGSGHDERIEDLARPDED
jgi:hypothetical protein